MLVHKVDLRQERLELPPSLSLPYHVHFIDHDTLDPGQPGQHLGVILLSLKKRFSVLLVQLHPQLHQRFKQTANHTIRLFNSAESYISLRLELRFPVGMDLLNVQPAVFSLETGKL